MPDEKGRRGLSENPLLQISLATQILCYTLVTTFVFLRLFLQRSLGKPVSADDVTCFIAWLLFMGYCTCALIYAFAGGANRQSHLTPSEVETSFKISYVSTIFYAPLALSVKVTLLLVLAKVYRPCQLGSIAIQAILALNILYYTIILFVKAFICTPVSAYWTSMGHPTTQCLNRFAVIVADSVISVVSDIAILVLPIILTLPLQMGVRIKLKVMALLGLGGIAIAFSLYRLVVVISDRSSPDQTILFMRILLSGNAEGGIGLICACLPALSRYYTHRHRHRHRALSSLPSPHAIQTWPCPIFDGSQGCNNGAADSMRSHLETRIWRSSLDSVAATAAIPHEIETTPAAVGRSMAIRKEITVRQQSDRSVVPGSGGDEDLIQMFRV
ncbi:hypothetical protein BJX64DRAFT_107016 [Aspergillus heterothallicus]